MGTKKTFLIMSLTVIIVLSCGTGPDKQQTAIVGSSDNSGNVGKSEAFDPNKISQEQYQSTMSEVQKFIEEQNRNIKNKNFEAWKKSLSPGYFAEISSKENLQIISESPVLKAKKIVLKTARDYFDNVVVPSRADLHVEEIKFISANKVQAFTVKTNKAGEEERIRLYDLEKIDNTWTIIN
jgi:dihydropteroate synthase